MHKAAFSVKEHQCTKIIMENENGWWHNFSHNLFKKSQR